MSNLAKDWQEGQYTVRIKDNLVEVDTIRPIVRSNPFGSCTFQKRYVATAKCDPEDEFNLSMGVTLAMDRLSKELDKGKIEVSNKVRIKNANLLYPTYIDWIKKNIDDVGLVACFAYGQFPNTKDTVYVVKAIAPWKVENDNGEVLVYVQRYYKFINGNVSNNEPCYLMSIDALEKIYE
jgi:hypothetical protein